MTAEPLTAAEEAEHRARHSNGDDCYTARMFATLDAARAPLDVERLRQAVINIDHAYPGEGWVEDVAREYAALSTEPES